MNEATVLAKFDTMLESSGWRFFAGIDEPANLRLEPDVTVRALDLNALATEFE